jgi:hypothetical protein
MLIIIQYNSFNGTHIGHCLLKVFRQQIILKESEIIKTLGINAAPNNPRK